MMKNFEYKTKRKYPYNNKIQAELASCAVIEGSKPMNTARLPSHNANLANPLNFGRWVVSLETENEKLTGLVFCFFVGFPIG
ncbi:MAG: hypothetical protein GY797_25125 [Deltaproteobacteria bacterium]|nr:hypothetical protein [Deltaproteobacteria bacterium]